MNILFYFNVTYNVPYIVDYIYYIFQSRCTPTSFFSGLPMQWFIDCLRSSYLEKTWKCKLCFNSSKSVFSTKQFISYSNSVLFVLYLSEFLAHVSFSIFVEWLNTICKILPHWSIIMLVNFNNYALSVSKYVLSATGTWCRIFSFSCSNSF